MIFPSREFSKAIFMKFLRAGLSPWLQNLRGSRKVSIGYLILLIVNLLMILIMLVLNGLPKQNNTIIYQIFKAINVRLNLLLFIPKFYLLNLSKLDPKQFILYKIQMTDLISQNRSFENNKVKIYIRGYSKKACKLTISNDTMVSDLKRIIKEKMDISEDSQLLFWKGKQLNNDLNIKFQPLSIIHVVNKKRINLGQISLFIKKVDDSTQIFTYTVSSDMIVEQFQEKNLSSICEQLEDWFLVYTGKRLNPKKTFKEEMVEDQSQILLVKKANIIDHVENKLAVRQVHLTRSKSIEKSKDKTIDLYKEKQFKGYEKCSLPIPEPAQNENEEVYRQKSLEVELSSANAQHSIPSSISADRKNDSISNEPEVGNQEKNEQQISEITDEAGNAKVHRSYSQQRIGPVQTPIEHVPIHKHAPIAQELHEEQPQLANQPVYEFSLYDLLSGKEPRLQQASTEHHPKIEEELNARAPEQITEVHSQKLQNKDLELEQNANQGAQENDILKNQQKIQILEQFSQIKRGQNSIDFTQIMNQRAISKSRYFLETDKSVKKEIVKKYQDGEQIRELKVDDKDRPVRIMNVFNPHQCQRTQQPTPSSLQETGMLNPEQSNSAHHQQVCMNQKQSEETDDHLVYQMKGKFREEKSAQEEKQMDNINQEAHYQPGFNTD